MENIINLIFTLITAVAVRNLNDINFQRQNYGLSCEQLEWKY